MGELAKAMLKKNHVAVIDGIGDTVVVLTNLIELYAKENNLDVNIEECINTAYNEIQDRQGEMINGSFVKQ